MERKPVSSSVFASAGYDPESGVFEAEYHNGKVYRSIGVPVELAETVLSAPSIGKAFNTMIKPFYPTTLVQPEAEVAPE